MSRASSSGGTTAFSVSSASSSSGASSSGSSASDGPSTPPLTAQELSDELPKSLSGARKSAAAASSGVHPLIPLVHDEEVDGEIGALPPLESAGGVEASWQQPHTFHTLDIQERFSQPSSTEFLHPELQKLVAPHIESFNMLWSADPSVDFMSPASASASASASSSSAGGEGLMQKAIRKLTPKVVYDGKGASPAEWENGKALSIGNRLEIWVESVHLGRPQVADRAKDARERRVFPTEVSAADLAVEELTKVSERSVADH